MARRRGIPKGNRCSAKKDGRTVPDRNGRPEHLWMYRSAPAPFITTQDPLRPCSVSSENLILSGRPYSIARHTHFPQHGTVLGQLSLCLFSTHAVPAHPEFSDKLVNHRKQRFSGKKQFPIILPAGIIIGLPGVNQNANIFIGLTGNREFLFLLPEMMKYPMNLLIIGGKINE